MTPEAGKRREQGGAVSPAGVLTPQVLAALGVLDVLSLSPVAYKKLTHRATVDGTSGARRRPLPSEFKSHTMKSDA